jgi:hypothetical protein
MILAVLTIFLVVSGIVIYFSIKGAIAVDENFYPVKENLDMVLPERPKSHSRTMIFLDFSRSRNTA